MAMEKVKMSDVYLIQNQIDGKQYIGIARQEKLNGSKHGYLRRFKEHQRMAGRPHDSKHYVLHRAMAKHGMDNFTVEKILSLPEEDAAEYEIMMIELYDCQVPQGYNTTAGGEGCSMVTERHVVEKVHASRWPNKELPMNIRYAKNGANVGYEVKKDGFGNTKAFTSSKYTQEENLQMAKDYLATLTERKPKTQRELPRHITRLGSGLIVQVRRNRKIVISKYFGKGTDDEQLEQAKAYVAHIKAEGLI